MTRRYLSNLLWDIKVWRMRKQKAPEHLILMAEIDRARKLHKPVRHLQQKLTQLVLKDFRA